MKADGFQVVPLVYTFPGIHKRERERECGRKENGGETEMKCARWRTFFQSCDDLKDLPFSFSFVFFFQSPFFFFFFPLDDISLFISFILFIVRQSSGGQKFNIASIKLLIPVVSFKKKKKENHLKILFLPFFRHSLFSDGSLLALCHQRETDQSFPLMPIDLIRHS